MQIPTTTPYSIRKGDREAAAYAVQRALNASGQSLVEDAIFGEQTERAVIAWQRKSGLTPDGIFGPASSAKMATRLTAKVDTGLPTGLLRGFTELESANLIAAVNWSVSGGVDCGYTQRRVLDGSTEATVRRAFNSPYQLGLLAKQLRERRSVYYGKKGVTAPTVLSFIATREERAWRLAALHHNWPYAASRLAEGYALSDRRADWVPSGTRFADGSAVVTYMDWARFYALGWAEKRHPGAVCKYVVRWS